MNLGKLIRSFFRPRPPPPPRRPADPRLEQDAWLGGTFARLGERYLLGPDSPEGARVLRRNSRRHVKQSRRSWKSAVRLARQLPVAA